MLCEAGILDVINEFKGSPEREYMLITGGRWRRRKLRDTAGAGTAERAPWGYQSLLLKQMGNRRRVC